MTLRLGVVELGIMDLKPRYRDDERIYRLTPDMLGKRAREAFETVGEAYFYPIPGGWIGCVAVTTR